MLPVDTVSAFMQFILAIDDTQLIPLTLDENDFGNNKIRSKFRYSISIIKLAGFAVLMYSGSGVPNRIHNAMALNPAGTNHKYRQI